MKIDLKKWRIGDYIRQLSVVVIGVAITFWGSSFLNNKAEKATLRKNLIAVKAELQHNMYDIDVKLKLYKEESHMRAYFKSLDNPTQISVDTLREYGDGLTTSFQYYYKKDAYEILKLSEGKSQLTDVNFLLTIMEAYRVLSIAKDWNDRLMTKKEEIISNIDHKANPEYFLNLLKEKEGYEFFKFIKTETGQGEHGFEMAKETILETLVEIDKVLEKGA